MPNKRDRTEKSAGTGRKKRSQDVWGATTQAAPRAMRRTESILIAAEATGDSGFGAVPTVTLMPSSGFAWFDDVVLGDAIILDMG